MLLTILAWVGIVLAIIVMCLSVVACLLGLPASIVVAVVATILSASTHWDRPPWWMLIIFVGMTALAETGDNVLSAMGTKKYGGSTRGAFWALVGGLTGAFVGGNLGPLIGALGGPLVWLACTLVFPLALGMTGGYLGGYWYEKRQGKPEAEARRAGWGAFLGRAAGALLRTILAATMTVLTVWMLFSDGGPFGG